MAHEGVLAPPPDREIGEGDPERANANTLSGAAGDDTLVGRGADRLDDALMWARQGTLSRRRTHASGGGKEKRGKIALPLDTGRRSREAR